MSDRPASATIRNKKKATQAKPVVPANQQVSPSQVNLGKFDLKGKEDLLWFGSGPSLSVWKASNFKEENSSRHSVQSDKTSASGPKKTEGKNDKTAGGKVVEEKVKVPKGCEKPVIFPVLGQVRAKIAQTVLKVPGEFDPDTPDDAYLYYREHNPLPSVVMRRGTSHTLNEHVASNIMRTAATMVVPYEMAGDARYAEKVKIMDLFGSTRDVTHYNRVGGGESFSADYGIKYAGDENKGPRVNVSQARAEFDRLWNDGTPPLSYLNGGSSMPHIEPLADTVVMTDVYMAGPRDVQFMVAASGSGRAFVITRRFEGYCGSDDVNGNMVWYKQADGSVVAYPDEVNPAYPAHPDSEWLFRSIYHLNGHVVCRSGPYYVLCFVKSDSVNRAAAPVARPRVNFEYENNGWGLLGDARQMLYEHLAQRGWTSRQHYDTAIAAEAVGKFVGRPLNGGNQTEIRCFVKTEMEKQKYVRQLKARRLGGVVARVFEDTVNTVFAGVLAKAEDIYDLRVSLAPMEELARAARAQNPPSKKRWTQRHTAVATAGVFVGGILARKYSPVAFRWAFNWFCSLLRSGVDVVRRLVRALTAMGLAGLVKEFVRYSLALVALFKSGVVRPAALNRKHPILSAIGEALLCRLHPLFHVAIVLLEQFLYGGLSIGHIFIHLLGANTPAGMLYHVAYNVFIHYGCRYGLVNPIAGRATHVNDHSHAVVDNAVRSLTPTVPQWSERMLGTVRVRSADVDILVKDQATLDQAYEYCLRKSEPEDRMWVILETPQAVFPSQKTAVTTLCSTVRRQLDRPNVVEGELRDTSEGWEFVSFVEESTHLYVTDAERARDVRKYLANTSSVARKNLLEGFAEAERGDSVKTYHKVFVKSNESLALNDKTRLIVNVAPRDQIHLVGLASMLKDYLMREFYPREWVVGGHVVLLFYCPGRRTEELDSILPLLAECEHAILVAGDDSLIKIRGVYYCNDFSKFDNSRTPASIKATTRRLRSMGASEDELYHFCDATSKRTVAEADGVRFESRLESAFPTGILLTTIVNSTDNLSSMSTVFYKVLVEGCEPEEAFAWCGEKLGFVLKVKLCPTLEDCDFLKGMFCKFGETYHHVPLPGMIFKISKMMNNPEHVFKKEVQVCSKRFPAWSNQKWSCYCMAKAIAESWKHVPREYPILGTFLRQCETLATLPLTVTDPTLLRQHVVEDARYKMWREERPVGFMDVEAVYAQMSRRYNLSVEELREMDMLIKTILDFPWRLEHDGFDRLLEVDYR